MKFCELVGQKIEERREGRSAAVKAAEAADARFAATAAPLVAAVAKLLEELASDRMFHNAMGRPDIAINRLDASGGEGAVKFQGRVGVVSIVLISEGRMLMRITPNYSVAAALDQGGYTYTEDCVQGEMDKLDEFVDAVRDRLADYLADIYLSAVAHYVLEPGKPRDWDA
jgi:hypothetical protein